MRFRKIIIFLSFIFVCNSAEAQATSAVFAGTLSWKDGTVQTALRRSFRFTLKYVGGRWYAWDNKTGSRFTLKGGQTKKGTVYGTKMIGAISCRTQMDVSFTPSYDGRWAKTLVGAFIGCSDGGSAWEMYMGQLRRVG